MDALVFEDHSCVQALYLEVRLDYLIDATGIRALVAKRRLWGLLNVLAALARRWRDSNRPIEAVHELRMNEVTRQRWLDWTNAEFTDDQGTIGYLAPYTTGAVIDPDVPPGWVRVLLN